MIKALRSTLTLAPESMFSYMFSGRWEDTLIRDDCGRVFLDHDPELIELIVNFLRTKKIENQSSTTIKSSKIPDGKKDEFESLLHYFGLTDFFYPPPVFLFWGGGRGAGAAWWRRCGNHSTCRVLMRQCLAASLHLRRAHVTFRARSTMYVCIPEFRPCVFVFATHPMS